ncbi:MAG: hypothetical protein COW65_10470 [Cytophagales bacterium CG18_big_fil_WC_8_21_14_2_50_42_9]|nr:MAG: hypothetical protein COW65_10470 [Cytophagales bacterium CG18_big_fil_WC_8_21_14_2_50_42_9]
MNFINPKRSNDHKRKVKFTNSQKVKSDLLNTYTKFSYSIQRRPSPEYINKSAFKYITMNDGTISETGPESLL